MIRCRIVENVDDNNILQQISKNDAELDAALQRIKELEEENRKLIMKDLPREIIFEGNSGFIMGNDFKPEYKIEPMARMKRFESHVN